MSQAIPYALAYIAGALTISFVWILTNQKEIKRTQRIQESRDRMIWDTKLSNGVDLKEVFPSQGAAKKWNL